MPSYANPYTRNNIPSVTVAPMTLGTSRYQPLMYTPSFSDANIITEGYNKKMELYGKAGQAMTAANAAIGKLYDSVDPSEYAYIDKLRAEYVDPIQNMINDGSYSRAVYYAGMSATELMFDKGLRGRINAKAKYDEFMTNLDTMRKQGEINDMTYNRMKEQNKYDYVDIYEDEDEQTARQNDALQKAGQAVERKGKIVRGTEWTPQFTPTKHYAASTILDEAITKFIHPVKVNGQSFYFLDKDGNTVTDAEKSVDGQPWIIRNGHSEKVTPEMIRDAVNALIAANPEYEASLRQDYEDKLWDYGKHAGNYELGGDLLNEHGVTKSFNSYIDSIFGNLGKHKAYNETTVTTNYTDAKAKFMAALGSTSGVSDITGRDLIDLTSPNNNFEVEGADVPAQHKAEIDGCAKAMTELLAKYGAIEESDDVLAKMSAEDKFKYLTIKDQYAEAKDWFDNFTATISGIEKDAVIFDSYAGSDAKSYADISDNEFVKRLNKMYQRYGIDDSSTILFVFDNEDNGAYQDMYDKLVGRKGINFGNMGANGDHAGKRFIQVPMSDANLTILAARAFNNANDHTTHGYWFTPNVKAYINGTDVQNFRQGTLGFEENPVIGSMFGSDQKDGVLGEIAMVYNQAHDYAKKATTKSSVGNMIVSNPNMPGEFISNSALQLQWENKFIEDSNYKALRETQLSEFQNKLRGHNLADTDIWLVDEVNGYMRKATPEERQIARVRLLNSDFKKINSSTACNPFSNKKIGINITLPGNNVIGSEGKKIGYNGPMTIYIDGFDADSKAGQQLQNDTWFNAYLDCQKYTAYNRNKILRVGDVQLDVPCVSYNGGGAIFDIDEENSKFIGATELITLFDDYNVYKNCVRWAAVHGKAENATNEKVKESLIRLAAEIADYKFGGNQNAAINIVYKIEDELGVKLIEE